MGESLESVSTTYESISGECSSFCIQWGLTETYAEASLLALGYFTVCLNGKKYGVTAPEATILACSVDSVEQRLRSRGKHIAPFALAKSSDIANSIVDSIYCNPKFGDRFFGMEVDKFLELIRESELLWAPDGDEAFDDGGHVLQFDIGDKVRLIGFINSPNRTDLLDSISEVTIEQNTFYGVLKEWLADFLLARLERSPR